MSLDGELRAAHDAAQRAVQDWAGAAGVGAAGLTARYAMERRRALAEVVLRRLSPQAAAALRLGCGCRAVATRAATLRSYWRDGLRRERAQRWTVIDVEPAGLPMERVGSVRTRRGAALLLDALAVLGCREAAQPDGAPWHVQGTAWTSAEDAAEVMADGARDRLCSTLLGVRR